MPGSDDIFIYYECWMFVICLQYGAATRVKFREDDGRGQGERALDRQKMLVSQSKSKVEQEYLASVAAKVVDLHEDVKNLVLVANKETNVALKVKLVQGTRGILEKMARLHKMSLMAAMEGLDCAQRMFNLAPTYRELEEEEVKQLEKFRKEKEASKKREATEQEKSGCKGVKRPFPYSKPGYSGYGGYGGGLNQGGGIHGGALRAEHGTISG
jgi:hypothetical protein